MGSQHQWFWIHRCQPNDPQLRVIANELETELKWAKNRPSSVALVTGRLHEASLRDEEFGDLAHYREPSPFELALNGMETTFLAGKDGKGCFRSQCPGGVFNLQNNPVKRRVCSVDSDATLPCLPKAMHLEWTDRDELKGVPYGRWLVATEALLSMGFRVRDLVRRPYMQSSFDICLPYRDGYLAREGAGNSMSASCQGFNWCHSSVNIVAKTSSASLATSCRVLTALKSVLDAAKL